MPGTVAEKPGLGFPNGMVLTPDSSTLMQFATRTCSLSEVIHSQTSKTCSPYYRLVVQCSLGAVRLSSIKKASGLTSELRLPLPSRSAARVMCQEQ